MNYPEKLIQSASEKGSILCFGIDPVIEKIPKKEETIENTIVSYYSEIIDSAFVQNRSFSALKLNYAFFAQYGFEGLRALKTLIEKYSNKLPIIFDGKRGDIGNTSYAYAKEIFDFWKADAATVFPYMGTDSILPFIERCKSGKGVYVLCKTSNKGAADFQELLIDKRELFLEVALKVSKLFLPGVGVVAGATKPEDIEKIMWIFYDSQKKASFLIPGVGSQGGSAKEVADAIYSIWPETFSLHRINASSSIAYAYQKYQTDDYVKAALEEIDKLNREIRFER